jgi:hypothetical protein
LAAAPFSKHLLELVPEYWPRVTYQYSYTHSVRSTAHQYESQRLSPYLHVNPITALFPSSNSRVPAASPYLHVNPITALFTSSKSKYYLLMPTTSTLSWPSSALRRSLSPTRVLYGYMVNNSGAFLMRNRLTARAMLMPYICPSYDAHVLHHDLLRVPT